MNRDIKFRAFDKLTNKMIDTGFHVIGEITMFGLIDRYIGENMDGKSSMERYNDIEITQYTGLKDKTGREIYEGDILVIPENDPESTSGNAILVVEHRYGAFGYVDTFTKRFDIIYGEIGASETDDCAEIIGNIFENPELIK